MSLTAYGQLQRDLGRADRGELNLTRKMRERGMDEVRDYETIHEGLRQMMQFATPGEIFRFVQAMARRLKDRPDPDKAALELLQDIGLEDS
jgi:hypothetical protein